MYVLNIRAGDRVIVVEFLITSPPAFQFIPQGQFESKMVTMAAMVILWLFVLWYIRNHRVSVPFFPKPFSKAYIIVTVVAALLLITTPANYIIGITAVLELVYGSIVTPVYEETIFRGYVWERLNGIMAKEVYVYIASSLLFMVWHLGYMIPSIIDGNWFAVSMKLAAGGVYGFILGFIRLKCRNCYLPMVVHGIMNLFMI